MTKRQTKSPRKRGRPNILGKSPIQLSVKFPAKVFARIERLAGFDPRKQCDVVRSLVNKGLRHV
jgi:hypothetical protein